MLDSKIAANLAESHKNSKPIYAILQGVVYSAATTLSIYLCYLLGSKIPHEKDNTSHFVRMTTLTALCMNMLILPTVSYGFDLYKKRHLATTNAVIDGHMRFNRIVHCTQILLFVAVSLGSVPLAEKFSSAPANETVSFNDGAARWGIGCGVLTASIFGLYCCLFATLAACMAQTNEPVADDERTPLNPAFSKA